MEFYNNGMIAGGSFCPGMHFRANSQLPQYQINSYQMNQYQANGARKPTRRGGYNRLKKQQDRLQIAEVQAVQGIVSPRQLNPGAAEFVPQSQHKPSPIPESVGKLEKQPQDDGAADAGPEGLQDKTDDTVIKVGGLARRWSNPIPTKKAPKRKAEEAAKIAASSNIIDAGKRADISEVMEASLGEVNAFLQVIDSSLQKVALSFEGVKISLEEVKILTTRAASAAPAAPTGTKKGMAPAASSAAVGAAAALAKPQLVGAKAAKLQATALVKNAATAAVQAPAQLPAAQPAKRSSPKPAERSLPANPVRAPYVRLPVLTTLGPANWAGWATAHKSASFVESPSTKMAALSSPPRPGKVAPATKGVCLPESACKSTAVSHSRTANIERPPATAGIKSKRVLDVLEGELPLLTNSGSQKIARRHSAADDTQPKLRPKPRRCYSATGAKLWL